MEEKKCDHCCRLPDEIPGMFLDFDADPVQGGDGEPLCSQCLGTGVAVENDEISQLSEKVFQIRQASFKLQINAIKKKQPASEWKPQLEKYNQELIDIAERALQVVKNPVKGCFAQFLLKDMI